MSLKIFLKLKHISKVSSLQLQDMLLKDCSLKLKNNKQEKERNADDNLFHQINRNILVSSSLIHLSPQLPLPPPDAAATFVLSCTVTIPPSSEPLKLERKLICQSDGKCFTDGSACFLPHGGASGSWLQHIVPSPEKKTSNSAPSSPERTFQTCISSATTGRALESRGVCFAIPVKGAWILVF